MIAPNAEARYTVRQTEETLMTGTQTPHNIEHGRGTDAASPPEPRVVSAAQSLAVSDADAGLPFVNTCFSSLNTFVEVDYFQICKNGQAAAGDVFLSESSNGGKRIVTTLSDGLGSGIQANVLASLTAKMIVKFVLSGIQLRRAAEIIVNSLPVSSKNGLSYATFTLLDIKNGLRVHIIEYDNPPYLIVRDGGALIVEKSGTVFHRKNRSTGPAKEVFHYSYHSALPGDRIVFFTDGVTQAGTGGAAFPSGWGSANAQGFVLQTVAGDPDISARSLAQRVVREALYMEGGAAHDDISCGVIYFRKPRDMLVLTGPPYHAEHDKELAKLFTSFAGTKIISGGTTEAIIARELGHPIRVNESGGFGLRATYAEGADLVTEGILTLGECAALLEKGDFSRRGDFKPGPKSPPAEKIVAHFLGSDRIAFVVGTKINEAHQDPTFPVELEIRRNVIKKIQTLLKERYMKEVSVRYL
ncbi:MAG: serine/threonine-protein phosphatase [Spirochaetaceae bacterium]|nr:serine/threonine-protein phosphatase [Spirochaetaceae bacterium]